MPQSHVAPQKTRTKLNVFASCIRAPVETFIPFLRGGGGGNKRWRGGSREPRALEREPPFLQTSGVWGLGVGYQ